MSDSRYLYEGELSPSTADYIRGAMREYPNVVELKRPPDWSWIGKNLPLYRWQEKSATTGHNYTKESHRYCIVSKHLGDADAGIFFFVPTVAEKQTVIEGCADILVNANPFTTVI